MSRFCRVDFLTFYHTDFLTSEEEIPRWGKVGGIPIFQIEEEEIPRWGKVGGIPIFKSRVGGEKR